MSKNNRYIKQFDDHCGVPSDFDDLFSIDNGTLHAKKRIRVTGKRRTAAPIVAASALLITAAGIITLNSEGISNGISEQSATPKAASVFNDDISLNNDIYLLSDITGHFDYYLFDYISDDSMLNSFDTSGIIKARVIAKEYEYSSEENPRICYTISISEYYLPSQSRFLASSDTVTQLYSYSSTVAELQPGYEYIIPIDIENEREMMISDNYITPIRNTCYGWLKEADGSSNSSFISTDIDGYGNKQLSIAKLDDFLTDYITSELNCDYNNYDIITVDNITTSVINYDFDIYESVHYDTLPDGSVDNTVIIIENESYFYLSPEISGKVEYTGKNTLGENMIVISPDNDEYSSIAFSGLYDISVSEGDLINAETIIGSCSSSPIYCRLIDCYGRPVSFVIE